jgi:hypothetical protein
MANSGAVVLNSVWHLVCSTEGPFKAYCGTDLYISGRPSLYVGSPYGAVHCEICSIKDKCWERFDAEQAEKEPEMKK